MKAKSKKGALEAAVAEEKARGEREVLLLQVESLQAQLQEQSKLAREQMEAMLEDRRVRMEEEETRRTRDADKVQLLTDKYVQNTLMTLLDKPLGTGCNKSSRAQGNVQCY
jgi:ElaB/YqjD/DUF883 family membrane-anchored ribosome-binding protein